MTAFSPVHTSAPSIALTVRDRRFGRGANRQKGADPVAAAWFLALSLSFPRGEAMFIDAVRAHREGVPQPLADEIRAFIRQEVNHTREHVAFNRLAAEAGYETKVIEQRVAQMVDETQALAPIRQLAITMALEHFTAMFAHLFLTDPDAIASDGIGDRDLWLWHAVEEVEHKGVAFDTWNHATRDWPQFRRWLVRSLIMLRVTSRFLRNRTHDALDLLAQDGITGWRARWRLTAYLLGKPGMIRRIIPAWLGFFRPGFHPWDIDDRALIAKYDSAFAAANLAQVPAA